MNTYYIANNKTGQATILQTNKTREEIWREVEESTDVVHAFDTVEEAQKALDDRNMQYVPYDSFIK